MSNTTVKLFALPTLAMGMLLTNSACTKGPDNAAKVRQSLSSAGYKDISVSEDHTKGVLTLTGRVASDSDKGRADSIARSVVGNEVVANEIAVIAPGAEGDSRTVNSDIDKGIRDNLDAALVAQHMKNGVNFSVKNAVVTLTGDVNSEQLRTAVQTLASQVPNVQQVVNELQVKNQRASSSN